MQVLNISVTAALQGRWRAWLAPARQPFFLTGTEAAAAGLNTVPRDCVNFSGVERDTFTVWRVPEAANGVAWLSARQWATLEPAQQRHLLKLQRQHGRGNIPRRRDFQDVLPSPVAAHFLWTPALLTPAVLERVISREGQACQRAQVPPDVWAKARSRLPRVQALAGTYSGGTGNCFGAVMGAAGLPGAEAAWIQRQPFEDFLHQRSVKGGQDDQPGTLLVWRSADGAAQHAAVTLGGGWAFHKPSQSWMTPRVIVDVAGLKRWWRTPGQRLERWRLLRPT